MIYIVTVLFFCNKIFFSPIHNFLISLDYIGILIGGFFYTYGFTSAPATALLLALSKQQNIVTAAIIAGTGALLSDVIIFLFIKYSFSEEIEELKREKIIKFIRMKSKKTFGSICHFILPVTAGFIIALPLPTEIGIAIMTSIKDMSMKKFLVLAYLLHTAGIFTVLLIGYTI